MNKLAKVGLTLGALALVAAGCGGGDPSKEHRVKAATYFKEHKYKEAVAEFEKAVAADPKSEKSWREKAFVHQQINEHDKAAEALTKYVELTQDATVDKIGLYGVIAEEYRQAGNPAEAEKALNKVLESKTTPEEKAEIHRRIADMFMKAQDLDSSERAFNEALKLNPKDTASLGWLATIYSEKGGVRNKEGPAVPESLDKALAYLDQIIVINPDDPAPWVNKRVVVNKYMNHELQLMKYAQLEGKGAKAEEHRKKAEEYKAQYEALTAEFTKRNEAAKAKKAAEGAKT